MSEFIELSIFKKLFGKKPKASIYDLDGTVASVLHREHFVESKPKDWSSFHGHMTQDSPIPDMVDLMRARQAAGEKILIVSLRPERYMDQVIKWLDDNGIPHDEIHLRPDGDYRRGVDVKRDILTDLIEPRFDVQASYDDNPKMVEMYTQELGADKVFHVSDPGVEPNKDIPPASDPKYPHGRPMEKILGDSPQGSLFQDDAHDIQQYKTENLFTGKGSGRVYVPPYVRLNPEGNVEHVDGYWRELSSPSAVDRLALKLADNS